MENKINIPKGKVRIRIRPLHGIGGVGDAGTEALMDKKEAEQYQKDGYLDILDSSAEVVVVPSAVKSEKPAGPLEALKNALRPKNKKKNSDDAEIIAKINAVTSIDELYAFQVEGRSEAVEEAINAKGNELMAAEEAKATEDHAIMKPEKEIG